MDDRAVVSAEFSCVDCKRGVKEDCRIDGRWHPQTMQTSLRSPFESFRRAVAAIAAETNLHGKDKLLLQNYAGRAGSAARGAQGPCRDFGFPAFVRDLGDRRLERILRIARQAGTRNPAARLKHPPIQPIFLADGVTPP